MVRGHFVFYPITYVNLYLSQSYTQKRPRRDKDSSGRPPDSGGHGGGGNGTSGGGSSRGFDGSGGGSRAEKHSTRPRGTSDAKWRTMGTDGSGAGFAQS